MGGVALLVSVAAWLWWSAHRSSQRRTVPKTSPDLRPTSQPSTRSTADGHLMHMQHAHADTALQRGHRHAARRGWLLGKGCRHCRPAARQRRGTAAAQAAHGGYTAQQLKPQTRVLEEWSQPSGRNRCTLPCRLRRTSAKRETLRRALWQPTDARAAPSAAAPALHSCSGFWEWPSPSSRFCASCARCCCPSFPSRQSRKPASHCPAPPAPSPAPRSNSPLTLDLLQNQLRQPAVQARGRYRMWRWRSCPTAKSIEGAQPSAPLERRQRLPPLPPGPRRRRQAMRLGVVCARALSLACSRLPGGAQVEWPGAQGSHLTASAAGPRVTLCCCVKHHPCCCVKHTPRCRAQGPRREVDLCRVVVAARLRPPAPGADAAAPRSAWQDLSWHRREPDANVVLCVAPLPTHAPCILWLFPARAACAGAPVGCPVCRPTAKGMISSRQARKRPPLNYTAPPGPQASGRRSWPSTGPAWGRAASRRSASRACWCCTTQPYCTCSRYDIGRRVATKCDVRG